MLPAALLTAEMERECTVGRYLVRRLVEIGIDSVFGVPGDYTLSLLDHVVAEEGLSWVGCTNELNAGYAADGYARVRGMGALCTTFGVGELSAINALAGSFAEHVPVVHVVGSPAVSAQAAHRIVHHSLGDGVFSHFEHMHREITCARAALTADNAPTEIDRVLAAVWNESLPGYLLIPADVADAPARLPAAPLPLPVEPTDPEALEAFTAAARQLLRTAAHVSEVCVLAGVLVYRLDAVGELENLLEAGPLPRATTLWGKSLVDESHPLFQGIYTGAASADGVQRAVEEAPVLIVAGVQFTDLNSGFFTLRLTRRRTIEIGAHEASVGSALYSGIPISAALRALAPLVAEMRRAGPPTVTGPKVQPVGADAGPTNVADREPLTQEILWDEVGRFLRPGDLVVADQGCSFYGAATHRLPADAVFIGQPLWASIGYSLPALLGACLAQRQGRGVLLIGDGAAQMSVQELSTAMRLGLSPVVVVVDNGGYTVERAIHGPTQPYNDIDSWDWRSLPAVLGPDRPSLTRRATTAGELREALAAARAAPDRLTMVQAVVPPMDVPALLLSLARAAASANAAEGAAERSAR